MNGRTIPTHVPRVSRGVWGFRRQRRNSQREPSVSAWAVRQVSDQARANPERPEKLFQVF